MRTSDDRSRLPVAVIGAGPMGLAAAAHLVYRGEPPLILEAGPAVGWTVRRWAHVRMFSPWRDLIDPAAGALLEEAGWRGREPGRIPTGGDLVREYLEPLALLPRMASALRLNSRVVAVARRGHDKARSAGREQAPFELLVRGANGLDERILARAVIDASGTYDTPNPLGANGLPVAGEDVFRHRMYYGIPDLLGGDRARYAGRRTLVVGNGHSAFHVLLGLAEIAKDAPGTSVVWAVRRAPAARDLARTGGDVLPERTRLAERAAELLEEDAVELVDGFHATRVVEEAGGIVIEGQERRIGPVDEIVVATGYRPDLSLTRELRLELDASLEAPVRLARLIDPEVHDCGTVPLHGVEELTHPEEDFFMIGMKSYGRAPTFLLSTGYGQVRSLAGRLVGDQRAARILPAPQPHATGCCAPTSSPSCALPGPSLRGALRETVSPRG